MRDLRFEDLDEIVRIHTITFPSSALTRLGPKAVRAYYRWQLDGPHDAARLGAVVDGHLAGFCFAGSFRGAMSGFLRENRLLLIRLVLSRPWLLRDVVVRDRLSSALRSLAGRQNKHAHERKSPRIQKPGRSFGILAIAVDPRFQRSGVGRELMREVEERALSENFPQMNLTVDTGNSKAVRFYESIGWEKNEQGGVWKGSMVKRLPIGDQTQESLGPHE